jgi:hypothetical protein
MANRMQIRVWMPGTQINIEAKAGGLFPTLPAPVQFQPQKVVRFMSSRGKAFQPGRQSHRNAKAFRRA